jgi:hypothetical protein
VVGLVGDQNLKSNTGPAITVEFVDELPCAGSGELAFACAEFPQNGEPGAMVYLKRDIDCGWTQSIAAYTLEHELGHTLGFAHAGDGTHIDGTKTCEIPGWSDAACVYYGLVPYDTVMAAGAYRTINCQVDNPNLSDDDFASAAALYPE